MPFFVQLRQKLAELINVDIAFFDTQDNSLLCQVGVGEDQASIVVSITEPNRFSVVASGTFNGEQVLAASEIADGHEQVIQLTDKLARGFVAHVANTPLCYLLGKPVRKGDQLFLAGVGHSAAPVLVSARRTLPGRPDELVVRSSTADVPVNLSELTWESPDNTRDRNTLSQFASIPLASIGDKELHLFRAGMAAMAQQFAAAA